MQSSCEIHAIWGPEVTHSTLKELLSELPSSVLRPRIGEAKTHYGEHRSQPMLTWWQHGPVDEVLKIVSKLSIPPIRLKVEATPSSLKDDFTLVDPDHYWEFHAKIFGASDDQAWRQAAQVCAPMGAHLFWNGCKEVPVPIIALRRYQCSKAEAYEQMAQLETALQEAGFTLSERHSEWGLLDSNPELDRGWLYRSGSDKTDFLREVPSY